MATSTIKINIGGNVLEVSGDFPLEDARWLVELYFDHIDCGKDVADHLKITIGAPIEQPHLLTKEPTMSAVQLTDTQQVDVMIAGADKKGFPADVESIAFKSNDESVATVVQDSSNPAKATIVAGSPGVTQVIPTADSKIGEGENILTGSIDVTVVAGEAAVLNATIGTPVEQP